MAGGDGTIHAPSSPAPRIPHRSSAMSLSRITVAAAGVTVAGLLAACGSSAPATGYAPVTSSSSAAPAVSGQLQVPGAPAQGQTPVQAPANVVPAGSAAAKAAPA